MIDDTIKKDVIPEINNKTTTEPEVVDVDLGFVEKKKFRINGSQGNHLSLLVIF